MSAVLSSCIAKTPADRLDVFAMQTFETIPSRKAAQKQIKREAILLNGEVVAPNHPVAVGDRVEVLVDNRIAPPVYDFPIPVIFEDDTLAVVHKPAGIPVSGNYRRTVQRALPANLQPSTAADALYIPRPVHRLDAPTIGLLLVAKTAAAMVALGRQFEERVIRKKYRAICLGRIEADFVADSPIDGRTARTRFEIVSHTPSVTTEWLTTLDAFPETGRKHQIRRHLSETGHPILGDDHYTEGKVFKGKGLFLAATNLQFIHPDSGKRLCFSIPEPPKFESLRKRETRRQQNLSKDS